jgi:hypothetical protein
MDGPGLHESLVALRFREAHHDAEFRSLRETVSLGGEMKATIVKAHIGRRHLEQDVLGVRGFAHSRAEPPR